MDGDDTDEDATLDSRRFVDGANEGETQPASGDGTPRTDGGAGETAESEGDGPTEENGPTDSLDAVDVDVESSDGAGDADSSVLDDVMLDDVGSDDPEEASQGLFDDLLAGDPIFENKEVLRPSYTPRKLPHREEQINNMATILVTALRGDSPSNILIYGKTGTGKTASAKFVSTELESTSQKYEVPCEVEYINCEVTDTQYRV
ncbi:MAG: Cdc6/Cdc18 family protein, partial [Halosimplex sp.]